MHYSNRLRIAFVVSFTRLVSEGGVILLLICLVFFLYSESFFLFGNSQKMKENSNIDNVSKQWEQYEN